MISPSTYPPQIHSYSTNVTTNLSTSERPNAFCRGQCELSKITHAHAGLITHKFHGSFRKIFYSFLLLWIKNFYLYCHTATFTRFLCYTRISPVQGKLAYWDFRLVRGLSHLSHQRIILPPEASIVRQPQGLCVWMLYDDTQCGLIEDFPFWE